MKSIKGSIDIGVKPEGGATILSLETADDQDFAADGEQPDYVPYGFISYRLEVQNYGDVATVNIYFSNSVENTAIWFDYDTVEGWQDFSEHAQFNATRDMVTIELKDGGYGDNDHIENKIIVDPSGIGINLAQGDDGGKCFIATAAFGSYLDAHVAILREFRDKYLLTTKVGGDLVKAYYKYSPDLADTISKNNTLRFFTRGELYPVVCLCYSIFHFGFIATVLGGIMLCLLPLFLTFQVIKNTQDSTPI